MSTNYKCVFKLFLLDTCYQMHKFKSIITHGMMGRTCSWIYKSVRNYSHYLFILFVLCSESIYSYNLIATTTCTCHAGPMHNDYYPHIGPVSHTIFSPYSVFLPEKLVYTRISPRKFEYILIFSP